MFGTRNRRTGVAGWALRTGASCRSRRSANRNCSRTANDHRHGSHWARTGRWHSSPGSGSEGKSVRKVKEGEVEADLFAFLTTEPNAEVGALHPKAMPVILIEPEEI